MAVKYVDLPDPERESAAGAADATGQAPEPAAREKQGGPRSWIDELVFVFVIVLFIKMFLVELYKIPSGSMTPTLLGGTVARVDANADGLKDLIYWDRQRDGDGPRIYLRTDGRYVYTDNRNPVTGERLVSTQRLDAWWTSREFRPEFDRILVNKLIYNFNRPARGDIVVFKVPPRIWTAAAPIYIKRLVGEPGDSLTFSPDGHLIANGTQVDEPPFFATQRYRTRIEGGHPSMADLPEVTYQSPPVDARIISRIDVPEGGYYVFGDNAHGSLDSRFWGAVPFEHFKGRAFLRYSWPFDLNLLE